MSIATVYPQYRHTVRQTYISRLFDLKVRLKILYEEKGEKIQETSLQPFQKWLN